jgi:hypothetical protein
MQIKSGPEATISESIYDYSWNHLSDELSRLDLLISLQLRRQRNVQTPNTEEQLRGLMLSEDEILNLLKEKGPLNSSDRSQPSDSEERQLIETIYQFESHLKQKRVSSLQEGVDLSLEHLSRLFCLTPFEEQCLIVCLAPEIVNKETGKVPQAAHGFPPQLT